MHFEAIKSLSHLAKHKLKAFKASLSFKTPIIRPFSCGKKQEVMLQAGFKTQRDQHGWVYQSS